jgi:hypothetical protein
MNEKNETLEPTVKEYKSKGEENEPSVVVSYYVYM